MQACPVCSPGTRVVGQRKALVPAHERVHHAVAEIGRGLPKGKQPLGGVDEVHGFTAHQQQVVEIVGEGEGELQLHACSCKPPVFLAEY